MHKLLEKVEKELHNIAEKGISSANLDTTYKLIDIYKDIKESEYYQSEIDEEKMEVNIICHREETIEEDI